jgi:hypothetical protein
MAEIRLRRLLPVLALGLCLAWPSRAVIIDLGDGTGNTSAPGDDPGWANVGTTTTGGLTAIYVGYGWILTAYHVGLGDVVLEGDTYEAVAGSYVRLENESGPPPDLGVFRIDPKPNLPVLPIRASTPSTTTAVVMIGNGRNRGSATSWPYSWGPYHGYEWGVGKSMRWGINAVEGSGTISYTESFYTYFTDSGGTTDEAQAANGDSGGPVFIKNGSVWELAGVMFAVAEYENQPAELALYGNLTYAADLASYRDQIIELTRPQCSDEVDNDGDELIDYPSDPGCFSAADPSERVAGLPALSPWGLALLVGLLAGAPLWMARRRRLGSL